MPFVNGTIDLNVDDDVVVTYTGKIVASTYNAATVELADGATVPVFNREIEDGITSVEKITFMDKSLPDGLYLGKSTGKLYFVRGREISILAPECNTVLPSELTVAMLKHGVDNEHVEQLTTW